MSSIEKDIEIVLKNERELTDFLSGIDLSVEQHKVINDYRIYTKHRLEEMKRKLLGKPEVYKWKF
ncbi:MAG: hypothetical protein WC309_04380 [Candidatus Paceibacterota bacterium]